MKLGPYLEVIIAATIWGSTGAFVKYLQLPPATLSFIRMFIPALILLVFFSFKKMKLFSGNNKMMILASSINAVRVFLYILGFTLTSIANAVIILYTWPIFVTIFSALLINEKISRRNTLLLLVAFLGMILIYLNREFSFADKDFLGMSAVLLSSILYSLTIVVFKKESKKYSNMETVFYQNIVGAVVFIPFLFVNPLPSLHQGIVGTTYAFLIGLVGFGLFFSALSKLKSSTASMLAYIEVISGLLFGILLFKEILTWNMIAGGSLIIFSTLMILKK